MASIFDRPAPLDIWNEKVPALGMSMVSPPVIPASAPARANTLRPGSSAIELMEQATGVSMSPVSPMVGMPNTGVTTVYPRAPAATAAPAAPAAAPTTGAPPGSLENPVRNGMTYTVSSVPEVAKQAANTVAAPKVAATQAPAEQASVGVMGGGQVDQIREAALRKMNMGGLTGLVVGRQMLAAARGMEQGSAAQDALRIQQQQLGLQEQQLAQSRNIEQARIEQGAMGMQMQQQTAREQLAQRAAEAEQTHLDRLTQNELQRYLAGQKNTLESIIADKVSKGDLAGVRAIQEAMKPKQAAAPEAKVVTDPIKGTSTIAIIGADGVPVYARVPSDEELAKKETVARQRGMP